MSGRAGFTLVEALIALVLSTLVIILVGTTFLVQNGYQARQVARAAVHDDVRAATEVVAGDLRSAMRGGITAAGNKSLTVRSPIAVAGVCERAGSFLFPVDVYLEGGVGALDLDELAGVALYRTSTRAWDYRRTSWTFVNDGSSGSAARCAARGADTVGVSDSYHRLRRLDLLFIFTPPPMVGDLVMLFRETTYTLAPSTLRPRTHALFRQPYGGSAVEVVSGLDSISEFRYRTGGTTYASSVTGASISDIDAVRLVFEGRRPAEGGSGDDVTFGWSRNVLLRNSP